MTDLVTASRPGATAGPPAVPRLALPVLLAGTFLVVLDFFIVNVALPSLQRDLHAGADTLEWVVAGYGLTFAALLLGAGRLGDRFGRRRVYALGIALFTATSAACGLATSGAVLVAARLAQGAAGALIGPSVLAIIGALYTGPARARAVGTYSTVMGLAAVSGQLIGGVLLRLDVAGLGWRAVFLLNVPIGVVVVALVPRCVPPSRAARPGRLDLAGLALAAVALTALVLPLLQGRSAGWPPWTLLSLAAAPVLLVAFLRRQRSLVRAGADPLLDPRLFRSRAFSVGLLAQLVLWAGQASYFLVLALYLQNGRGLDPLRSGLVFTVLAVAYLAASAQAPKLAARYGRRVVIAGAAVFAAGHLAALVAVRQAGPVPALVPGLLLTGAGMGLCLTALMATVLASADAQQAGAVSGLLATVQQVGNAIGVAVIGIVFFGALDGGYPHAFGLSLGLLAGLLAALAVLSLGLPPGPRPARRAG
ncbi:MAG TPA: MFS transporter [Mycobacteriales bacterium]